MPAAATSGIPNNRFFTEPRRAPLTPSASPSLGPPDRPPAKRPRHRSTPSSISATSSSLNESTSSTDVNSARRASTLRVLNTWAQLAERHSKRLDEDDIIDLHSFVIIKDRGAVKSATKDYHIGHFTQLDSDQDYPDADQDQEDSEQDDDDNELNGLPPSETNTDDDPPISKKELLRGVPPLSTTTDAEDLREFLQAEERRRDLAGDEGDEEDMSPEQLSALRKALEEQSQKREAAIASQVQDVTGAEHALEHETDATPTRPSTRIPLSDDESEDELALWARDESTAIYPVARDESEQDAHEVEREVIELTESDSDEEFEAILTHPPRFPRVSPLKEVRKPLQSPPDSKRGRSKSRLRSSSGIKPVELMLKSENRSRSPLPRKPEVVLAHKRKPSVPKVTGITTSDDGGSARETAGRISLSRKGKGKEIPPLTEDGHHEKTPKSPGLTSRGRKRKRIASSSVSDTLLARFPVETRSTLRSRRISISQGSITPPQPDSPKLALTEDVSTPVRCEPPVASSSRSLPSFPSTSKAQPPTLSVPACGSFEFESPQPTLHDRNVNKPLELSDPAIPTTHHYSQRHSSHPPSFFSSPTQATPGLSLPAHPPPPIDPVQTRQAQYLLAQAMHQLSYLISATMPPYHAYGSSPGQPWHHPLPPPEVTYSTPVHHLPHSHVARHYHTPSSNTPRSDLPPSSPVESPVTPPVEEQRARSRGRSKSRGRRVSFKLDSGEVIGSREHNLQLEHHCSGQRHRKQILESKREKGKGKAIEGLNNSPRLEEGRGGKEVVRERTSGPPSHKKIDVPRGRSLNRR